MVRWETVFMTTHRRSSEFRFLDISAYTHTNWIKSAAITDGNRCGSGCAGTTITPATVYFPQGTYLVSAPLIAYYYTEMVGDAKVLPTLKASAGFAGIAVIDVDPYIDGGNGAEWYVNQNNFYRSVRNFRYVLYHCSRTLRSIDVSPQN